MEGHHSQDRLVTDASSCSRYQEQASPSLLCLTETHLIHYYKAQYCLVSIYSKQPVNSKFQIFKQSHDFKEQTWCQQRNISVPFFPSKFLELHKFDAKNPGNQALEN